MRGGIGSGADVPRVSVVLHRGFAWARLRDSKRRHRRCYSNTREFQMRVIREWNTRGVAGYNALSIPAWRESSVERVGLSQLFLASGRRWDGAWPVITLCEGLVGHAGRCRFKHRGAYLIVCEGGGFALADARESRSISGNVRWSAEVSLLGIARVFTLGSNWSLFGIACWDGVSGCASRAERLFADHQSPTCSFLSAQWAPATALAAVAVARKTAFREDRIFSDSLEDSSPRSDDSCPVASRRSSVKACSDTFRDLGLGLFLAF